MSLFNRLVLRFRCDSPTAIVSLGSKFGCDPKYAVNLLKIARTLDLNVIGVCFHVGTEVKDPQIYNTALSICREIFDDAKDLGYNFTFVDIGGGFDGAKGSSLESVKFGLIPNSSKLLTIFSKRLQKL